MTRLKSKIYLVPIVLVFISVVTIYYSHYGNAVEIIKSKYGAKIDLIEESIYNEIKYTDMISKVAEKHIQHDMEENSNIIIDYYNENPNVLEWDLQKMKVNLDNMDIYIIDKNIQIIASTVEEEVGLNFNDYGDYSETIKKRLKGNTFQSEDINFSLLNDELAKYSYMPTPDNEYLIELSLIIQDIHPELHDLNVVYLAQKLENDYTFVENIGVYKYNQYKEFFEKLGERSTDLMEYTERDKELNKYIKLAIETNEIQEKTIGNENGYTYSIKYTPYTAYNEEGEIIWWKSYVIENIYNNQIVMEKIKYQRKLFLHSVTIIIIIYFGFVFIIKSLIEKNKAISHQDHLTKLPNRKRFEEVMEHKILEASKKNTKIAVLFFDLDKFKAINDTYGHEFGDKVLIAVANRINHTMSKDDMASRMGGDEYTALICGLISEKEAGEIGEQMATILKEHYMIGSEEINIRTSIGISIYPDHGDTVEKLIQRADDAMYQAKQNQLNYKIYS